MPNAQMYPASTNGKASLCDKTTEKLKKREHCKPIGPKNSNRHGQTKPIFKLRCAPVQWVRHPFKAKDTKSCDQALPAKPGQLANTNHQECRHNPPWHITARNVTCDLRLVQKTLFDLPPHVDPKPFADRYA
ncbi:hypothetical protein N9571_01980 [Yoonia sp.]|nr:hypothetical protein [Yoonia sp.]